MKLLNKILVKKLTKKKLTISVAESCTGGLLSSSITSVRGSSKTFKLGLITYSNQSKNNLLRIPKKMIRKYGAVSKQVCFAMVKNLKKISGTNISISITGIAGPTGGSKNKPVGLVYIGLKKGNTTLVNKYFFKNKGRRFIQKSAVIKSLELILNTFK